MKRPTKPPTPEERFAALVARAARHLTPDEAQLLHAGFDSLAASRRSGGALRAEIQRLKDERNVALAACNRVRQMADAWEERLPDVIRTATAADAIRHALEHVPTPAERSA